MIEEYNKHVNQRNKLGIVPKPLNVLQVTNLLALMKNDTTTKEKEYLLDLLIHRVPSGVDEAAHVKANFLANIAKGKIYSEVISPKKAVYLLGTMQGGYNVLALIDILNCSSELSYVASCALKNIILIFDNFSYIEDMSKAGNEYAKDVLRSWAEAEWFMSSPPLSKKITVTVFKVNGETNTDDLSPGQDAWSRPDIPLHALKMLKEPRDGIIPDQPGHLGPIKQINMLKQKGFPIVYVGDIVGTGSSRKSAANSILWYTGNNIPFVPNKRNGGILLASKIAPIFFNTMEDAGALPIEVDVSKLNMGDIINIYPFDGKIFDYYSGNLLATFNLKTNMLLDEVRAGGRIAFIIGRNLTMRACHVLKKTEINHKFIYNTTINNNKGFTLAQKIVGYACHVEGIHPHQYCEPKITSIGSQDTTGPMTRDELKDLACLNFSADFFLQSFCHTAAYPKTVDLQMHNTLPNFITSRGGVSLHPGDGIIHSWLNRMLIPDTVGTGADSHTRFPIGISFPAGSGLVAFAAATGIIPLNMPESVLVRFSGIIQPNITLRDIVHSIPYFAVQKGLLTIEKKNKKNIFSGRILEIEGLPNLKIEQAFELADSSAERSAAGCTIKLNSSSVIEYLSSNVILMKWMISKGYQNSTTIARRISKIENWLKNPILLQADKNAEYAEVIDIDLNKINEPILCIPNDPDDTRLLSDISGNKIDEVFIGSCMTNIGHFRVAGNLFNTYYKNNIKLPVHLWVTPPTKMDAMQLLKEGYYDIFSKIGAQIEIPGCSLCMGNQIRVKDNAAVVSTSTRNFPHRLGNNANVFLASSEVSAITALLGRIPTIKEYMQKMTNINKNADNIYKYLNFHLMNEYKNVSGSVIFQTSI